MISWASKDPNEVRSYRYSWLGRLNGAEIASATLAVDAGTIVLSNVANDINSISATISGGRDCEDAVIISTIVTDAGETLEEAITLKIRPSLTLNLAPSTSTKRQIVEMAYEEVSLSGYEFDQTPEELFSGLRQLDANMATDAAQSIALNYNFPPTFGGGDLEDMTGIPDGAVEYAALRLAKALCSKMGKTLNPMGLARLGEAKATVRALTAVIPDVGFSYGTPAGAGNRRNRFGWGPFLSRGRRC